MVVQEVFRHDNAARARETVSQDASRQTGRRDDDGVNRRPREDTMESVPLVDCAGRCRSPATLASFHHGRAPRDKGLRYPPDPPTVKEIIAVMGEVRGAAGDAVPRMLLSSR
jgi:hypothetical protein